MWRLMIADDEPKIRGGLRKSIQWEDKGIAVVGEAEDGEEALEKAKSLKPDIMLVDICMPFIDGLELIDMLRQELPGCQFIVITGYDEFDYAQKAVKLKVFDFILKPVVITELTEVIDKAVDTLNHRRKHEAYLQWVHRKIDDDSSVIKTQFFKKWLTGTLTNEEVEEEMQFLNLDLKGHLGLTIVKLIEPIHVDRAGIAWENDLREFALMNVVEEFLKRFHPYTVLNVEKGHVVSLLPIKAQVLWANLGYQLEQTVEETLGFRVCVSQQDVDGYERVRETYRDLLRDVNEKSALTPIVQSARKFINSHYSRPDLTLQHVGDALQVSPTYLSKLLKKELGCSFIDYLTRVRIKHAVRYMHDPASKVYEIAERVGYNSQHYFSIAFKKMMGVSPVAYRKGRERHREGS